MKLSIIVVALNAGDELRATVKSIITQSYSDLEIIVKDGGSTDGSLEKLPDDSRIRVVERPDAGIYDAMNQALEEASGDYIYFLNCGDYLYDEHVLEGIAQAIDEHKLTPSDAGKPIRPLVIYGDIYDRIGKTRVASNPVIDEFACFRNVPCHQACIYDRKMLLMHPFQIEYRVRADYEQFLWCINIAQANTVYLDIIVASYMGGGFSESRGNRRQSAREHRAIVENYMPHSHVVKYRWRMILSMAPLRAVIARNPLTSGMYNKLKAAAYSKRKGN